MASALTQPQTRVVIVAFLGPPGTYSHQAALRRFPGSGHELRPFGSIARVVLALLPGGASPRPTWAVVPLHNSAVGPVAETLAVLRRHDVLAHVRFPPDELELTISHCLVQHASCSPSASSSAAPRVVQRVASHVQALEQCQNYLRLHYPHIEQVHTSSTAQGAALAASDESGSTLAICSADCARLFSEELVIVEQDIQDFGHGENVTTFAILEAKADDADRGE